MSALQRIRNMRLTTATALGLIAAGSVILAPGVAGATVVSGASETGTPPDYFLNLDCGSLEFPGEINYYAQTGGSLTISPSSGCDGLFMNISQYEPSITAEPGGISAGGTDTAAPATNVAISGDFTVDSNTIIDILGTDDTFTINYTQLVVEADDPAGALAVTTDVTISGDAPLVATFPEDLDPDHPENDCGIESGEHVYQTVEIDIANDGEYTFRLVDATDFDPEMYWWGDRLQIHDAFLAVYTDFDPNDPSANVVGCNDQRPGNTSVTGTGYLVTSYYPEFTSTLNAGHYTLVLTTFVQLPASDWTSGDQTGTFELWGVADSLVLTPVETTDPPTVPTDSPSPSNAPAGVSETSLATSGVTGSNAAILLGFGAILLGASVFAIGRRRALR